MKQFPRIHSLGTINIIHHQEFFYKLHPFRTDFVGESGAGKSIVTDLLQLILVGSTEYSSSTQGKDDRPFYSLVLKNVDNSDFGFAYINVEVAEQKYLVLGTYIELNGKQSQAFIVQKSLDFDEGLLQPLDAPLTVDDFEKDGNWIPIRELDHFFNVEKEIGFRAYHRFGNYHEVLYKNSLLPKDITSKSALQDYAKILQAFSRKGISVKDGVDLQEFLFGKQEQTHFFREFESVVASMQDSMDSYRMNRDELQIIKQKKLALDELFKLKNERATAENKFIQLLHYSLVYQRSQYRKDLEQLIKNYFRSRAVILELNKLSAKTKDSLGKELEILNTQLSKKIHEQSTCQIKVNSIKTVDDFMQSNNLATVDELRQVYLQFQDNKKLIKKSAELKNLLSENNLSVAFDSLSLKDGYESAVSKLEKNLAKKQEELAINQALNKFSNIDNKKSLAYWVIKNNENLTKEQESIIWHFQELETEMPKKLIQGSKYIPDPSKLMRPKYEKAVDNEYFWADFGGINFCIKYVEERLFDGREVDKIIKRFENNRKLLGTTINSLEVEIKNVLKLLKFLRQLAEPQVYFEAWLKKDNLNPIKTDFTNPLLTNNIEFLDIEIGKYSEKETTLSKFTEIKKEVDELVKKIGKVESLKELLDQYQYFKLDAPSDLLSSLSSEFVLAESEQIKFQFAKDNFFFDFDRQYREALQDIVADEKAQKLKDSLEDNDKRLFEIKLEYEGLIFENVGNASTAPEEIETAKDIFEELDIEYKAVYKVILKNHVENDLELLEQTEDFKILVRTILPNIFNNIAFEESEVMDKIGEYLDDINRKNAEITKNKLVHIRDLLQDLQTEVLRQTNIVRKINNFFKKPFAKITGGHHVSLKKHDNPRISVDWIVNFLEELSVINEGLFNPTGAFLSEDEKSQNTSIADHIKDEYLRHSKSRNVNVTLKELLNPFSYYSLNYSIQTAGGQRNSGSTGQTYTAIALLCIAKLSLTQENPEKIEKGLRFMSIDEAAGIGSNFDMLGEIAEKYDYQILSLSIGLNRLTEGNQYIYRLYKNPEEDFVNHHPVPIFSSTE